MAKRAQAPAWKYRFEAPIEMIDYGRMVYWAVFLPPALAKLAAFDGGRPLRMRGVVGGPKGIEVALAWQRKGGRRYILVSQALARAIKVSAGSSVQVAFDLVSADHVVVPDELAEAMRQEPGWRALWRKLSPGEQRGAAHRVASARTAPVRADRAIAIFRALEDGQSPLPTRPPPGVGPRS